MIRPRWTESVKPGDDFFDFVNGSWAKRTEIAADRTFVGDRFGAQRPDRDATSARSSRKWPRTPPPRAPPGSQVGDYLRQLDGRGRRSSSAAPRRSSPISRAIAAVTDRGALLDLFADHVLASARSASASSPIPTTRPATRPTPARRGSACPTAIITSATAPNMTASAPPIATMSIKMQTLAGIADAAATADRIIALENAIATAHWTPERSRDTKATNNPMTRAQLAALAPQFDWDRTLRAAWASAASRRSSSARRARSPRRASCSTACRLSTWKDYLAFHFIRSHAQYLPARLRRGAFQFLFEDAARRADRSATAGSAASSCSTARSARRSARSMSRAIIRRPATRQMGELITNLRGALGDRIDRNTWMDEATRKEALAKLASFDPRIGHPAKFIDYSTLKVDPRRPARQCRARATISTGTCSCRACPSRSTARCGT